MRQRLRKRIVVVIVAIALMMPAMAGQQVSPDRPGITVTLLGSGGGPNPNPKRFGPSILVQAGRQTLLFDCGRGATIRLAQIGKLTRGGPQLFSDPPPFGSHHRLAGSFLTGWGAQGRKTPLRIWGPAGTAQMMDHMQKAFEFDIRIRRDVDEKFAEEGIMVSSTDIKEGVVFEEDGVTVTAFLVDHRPIEPAFGYRVDYGGRSVAMSGDTRFSENLMAFARGVDVLVHEALDPREVRARLSKMAATQEEIDNVVAHHITAEEAGAVFSRVKPRLAVYAHISDADLITPARQSYSGPLEAGEDLMTIEIGETVAVRRANR